MKLIECPRDAMQGLTSFIPTKKKILYLNQLLQVGFDTIDFGSFVSVQAIPQMKDTAEVVEQLNWQNSKSKLLAIIANTRGAKEASQFEAITYLGFPLSLSETFQKRNTNKSIVEAFNTIEEIQNICIKHNKKLVTYLSMGFGNPYGDPYDVAIVTQFVDILATLGSNIISLADTVGVSNPQNIDHLFTTLSTQYKNIELGVHLHSHPATALEKIEAAFNAGCKRFDSALKGLGGCPMAKDDLVGNLATETLIHFLEEHKGEMKLNKEALNKALQLADEIFPKY